MNAPYDDERLSKRELIAAMAMQSLIIRDSYNNPAGCADDAVGFTDALLARLATPAGKPEGKRDE